MAGSPISSTMNLIPKKKENPLRVIKLSGDFL